MELQRLRHILCVAEEGHFGRAAQRLGMTQPPLSQSIRRSERELGVALFERTPKGAVLTAAGRAFLPEARVAVAAVERATAQARAVVKRHPVRVGVASPAIWGPLPTLLRIAQEASIAVELIEASTNDQLEAIANGELDMGLLSPPFDAPPRMRVIDLSTDRLVAAMPERMAGDRALAPLALLAERLILFPQRQGPFLHAAILNLFATHGLSPVIVQEARDMMPGLMLVAAGLGSTLVPESLALRVTIREVAFRPLADVDEAPTWPLAVAHMPLSAGGEPGRLLGLWRRIEGAQTR
jgi:DNA-binding transcriptional LysR family regulator